MPKYPNPPTISENTASILNTAWHTEEKVTPLDIEPSTEEVVSKLHNANPQFVKMLERVFSKKSNAVSGTENAYLAGFCMVLDAIDVETDHQTVDTFSKLDVDDIARIENSLNQSVNQFGSSILRRVLDQPRLPPDTEMIHQIDSLKSKFKSAGDASCVTSGAAAAYLILDNYWSKLAS